MTASPPPVLPDERLASGFARLALRCRGRFSPETMQRLVTELPVSLPSTEIARSHDCKNP